MSINYTLHIKRKDGQEIAELNADCIKSILTADEGLLDVNGGVFHQSYLFEIIDKCRERIKDITVEINRLQQGVFSCKSVEVKRDIEEDIMERKESAETWMTAMCGVYELIGAIRCVCEDLLMDKRTNGSGYTEYKYAYQHWAVKDGKDVNYFWAADAELSLSYSC